jgi:hypothetical protein
LSALTYEELFFERAAPVGHYIFTDFDRLSRYEVECAALFAKALRTAAPDARILNHPLKSLDRYPLLIALNKAGINDFTAIRVEGGERPKTYPVFIRAEDGYGGPETDLLYDDNEFDAAIDDLRSRGLPMRGRVAIGFANERSADGYFHKYGAFNLAGTIIPHDRLSSRHWAIKFFPTPEGVAAHDEEHGQSDQAVAMELDYVRQNPHQEVLARAFAVAGIDFGRADYGMVNDRVQIYEINTNPHIPFGHKNTKRWERRLIIQNAILEGLRAINIPLPRGGRVSFEEARPRAHNLHWPRRRLLASLTRRAIDRLARRSLRGTP